MILALQCLPCIVDKKVAELQNVRPVPPIRSAVALFNGQTVCAEHIQVAQQSVLQAPNGGPMQLPTTIR